MDPNVVPVRAPVTVVGDIHGQVRVVFHQIKTPFDAPLECSRKYHALLSPFPIPRPDCFADCTQHKCTVLPKLVTVQTDYPDCCPYIVQYIAIYSTPVLKTDTFLYTPSSRIWSRCSRSAECVLPRITFFWATTWTGGMTA